MRRSVALMALLAVAGCGRAQENGGGEALAPMDVQEPAQGSNRAGPLQIAYSYTLGYALPEADIAVVQGKQVAICNKLGPARCRIARTSLNSDQGRIHDIRGSADFLIDARLAGAFIARLDSTATQGGGTIANRQIEAEDVTKQVIDVEARVRAKEALAQRLAGLIQSTNAKVADLVAAEQAFSETQEQLDAARSLQAALRQRVAMSKVTVSYDSDAVSGTWGPVTSSTRLAGETLATSIAAFFTFIVALLPWAAALAILLWVGRWRGWRLRAPWSRKSA